MPGTVLAVGVLLPLGAVDAWLAAFVQREFGVRTGLLLTGTIVALIYAYLVRYFAVAWNGIEPGFARITPNMDAAARSLGAGTAGTLLRVHAPLLARTAAAAALLVFVDVMKELPATLVLRPFNFDTLATQTYTLAQDERLAEAALPSLAIVAVGVLPLLILARAVRRGSAAGRHGAAACDPAQIAALAHCLRLRTRRTVEPCRERALRRPADSERVYFQPARSRSFCAAGVFLPSVAIGTCRP